MKQITYSLLFLLVFATQSCGIYSFTGTNIQANVKTVQIDYFPNNAILVEPTLSQTFYIELQDLFLQQTNLDLVNRGEIYNLKEKLQGIKLIL